MTSVTSLLLLMLFQQPQTQYTALPGHPAVVFLAYTTSTIYGSGDMELSASSGVQIVGPVETPAEFMNPLGSKDATFLVVPVQGKAEVGPLQKLSGNWKVTLLPYSGSTIKQVSFASLQTNSFTQIHFLDSWTQLPLENSTGSPSYIRVQTDKGMVYLPIPQEEKPVQPKKKSTVVIKKD